ncbi:sensor histidine kinase [Virgibacillus soli]|uniref:Sensor histidine kinase n=1 Tax=Paracerasibacillus soli TaxID=480284 RepID=A0ABU5CNW7_9BACI|nr:sensor histidine kinase [Virgibacillus soli]MDY0407930.1 sensor histidine kinase [Virgibacillus soli]
MNLILKQIFTAILYSILLTAMTTGALLIAFPIENWTTFFDLKVGDIPFLAIIIFMPLLAGFIYGVSSAIYWQQRVQSVRRQLDDVIAGQVISKDEDTYPELAKIEEQIDKVQEKLRIQTEHVQKMATERANERERSLQEIVVQERNRLARELHDSVSQQLFAASMMMSTINETNPPQGTSIKRQLQMVEKMIHQSQLEMRALLLHLRPVPLKGKSIQDGMEELLMELTHKVPMEIEWKIEQFQVEKGVEDQLFRILQEAVSNTLRHAKATMLHVMLIERDETIILRIVDNGIGFDVEETRTMSSYGLSNMNERAIEVGGTMKFISIPGEGTRLEVKVPKVGGVNHD